MSTWLHLLWAYREKWKKKKGQEERGGKKRKEKLGVEGRNKRKIKVSS